MATSPAEAPGSSPTGGAPVYTERLTPSPLAWLLAPTAGLTLWFMVSALSQVVGAFLAVAGTAAAAMALWATSPRVEVTVEDGHRHLRAAKARIAVDFLGEPQVLDAEAMQRAMGPELHSGAYVCQRGWIRTGVLIPVTDPRDPTPYWLISTRSPDRLVEALNRSWT